MRRGSKRTLGPSPVAHSQRYADQVPGTHALKHSGVKVPVSETAQTSWRTAWSRERCSLGRTFHEAGSMGFSQALTPWLANRRCECCAPECRRLGAYFCAALRAFIVSQLV